MRYFSELTNMACLTEEVGELARIMARRYGDQSFKEGESHDPSEEMVGKEVVIIAILQPVTLRGIDSQGMILCACGQDGKIMLVSPESAVESGAVVR